MSKLTDVCQRIGKHYDIACGAELKPMMDEIEQYTRDEIKRFIPFYEIARETLQKDKSESSAS